MSVIGAATSSASDISPLLANSSDASPETGTSGSVTSDATGNSGRDPATRVDLSDKVKAILARASTDQDVADRLKAFVEAHRINNAAGSAQDGSPSSGQSAETDVNKSFEQLSGGTPAGDDSDNPVQVAKNFATGLTADGYRFRR